MVEVRGDKIVISSKEVGTITWDLPAHISKNFALHEFGFYGVPGLKEAKFLKEEIGNMLERYVHLFCSACALNGDGSSKALWALINNLLRQE